MDSGTLSVVVPIALAAAGGLAFLACNHPRRYKSLALVLDILLTGLLVGGGIWDFSNLKAHNAAMNSGDIAAGKIDHLSNAIRAYALPWWWIWVILATLTYVTFLGFFCFWLLIERTKPESTGNQPQQNNINGKRDGNPDEE